MNLTGRIYKLTPEDIPDILEGKPFGIDYFFFSEYILNDLIHYQFLPGLFSNHSILEISLGNHNL
jgi:hypothetical protein